MHSSGSHEIQPLTETPNSTVRVLASCHSLTFVDEMLVGDPMEKAVVKAMEWSVGKGNKRIQNQCYILLILSKSLSFVLLENVRRVFTATFSSCKCSNLIFCENLKKLFFICFCNNYLNVIKPFQYFR